MSLFTDILKFSYPLRMKFSKAFGTGRSYANDNNKKPSILFYSLETPLNSGELFRWKNTKAKKY